MVISSDHGFINPAMLNRQIIDQKIAEFRTTLRHDSKDAMAHYGLGLAYFNLQLWEEAADELKLAARLMPENAHIQFQYAVILVDLAKRGHNRLWAEAQERLDRALRLRPEYVDALLLKAEISAHGNDWEEAYRLWSEAMSIDLEASKNSVILGMLLKSRKEIESCRWTAAAFTWRHVADLDPGIIRTPLVTFLNEHRHLVPLRVSADEAVSAKPTKERFFKGLAYAAVGFCVWLGVMILWLLLLALASSQPNNRALAGTALALTFVVFAAMFALPITGFWYGMSRLPAAPDNAGKSAIKKAALLAGNADTNTLLRAASEVAHRLTRELEREQRRAIAANSRTSH